MQNQAISHEDYLKELLHAYDWYEHPEGPKFVETHRDSYRTSGHWLFLPGAISAFHQVLNNEELWLIHEGKLLIHVIDLEGNHTVHRLGKDIQTGEKPVISIPQNYWQAAELAADTPFAFGTNVCAPCFDFEEFTLASREELSREFPEHRALITRLTHKE